MPRQRFAGGIFDGTPIEDTIAELEAEFGRADDEPFIEVPALARLLGTDVTSVLAMQQDALAVAAGYAEGAALADYRRQKDEEAKHGAGQP